MPSGIVEWANSYTALPLVLDDDILEDQLRDGVIVAKIASEIAKRKGVRASCDDYLNLPPVLELIGARVGPKLIQSAYAGVRGAGKSLFLELERVDSSPAGLSDLNATLSQGGVYSRLQSGTKGRVNPDGTLPTRTIEDYGALSKSATAQIRLLAGTISKKEALQDLRLAQYDQMYVDNQMRAAALEAQAQAENIEIVRKRQIASLEQIRKSREAHYAREAELDQNHINEMNKFRESRLNDLRYEVSALESLKLQEENRRNRTKADLKSSISSFDAIYAKQLSQTSSNSQDFHPVPKTADIGYEVLFESSATATSGGAPESSYVKDLRERVKRNREYRRELEVAIEARESLLNGPAQRLAASAKVDAMLSASQRSFERAMQDDILGETTESQVQLVSALPDGKKPHRSTSFSSTNSRSVGFSKLSSASLSRGRSPVAGEGTSRSHEDEETALMQGILENRSYFESRRRTASEPQHSSDSSHTDASPLPETISTQEQPTEGFEDSQISSQTYPSIMISGLHCAASAPLLALDLPSVPAVGDPLAAELLNSVESAEFLAARGDWGMPAAQRESLILEVEELAAEGPGTSLAAENGLLPSTGDGIGQPGPQQPSFSSQLLELLSSSASGSANVSFSEGSNASTRASSSSSALLGRPLSSGAPAVAENASADSETLEESAENATFPDPQFELAPSFQTPSVTSHEALLRAFAALSGPDTAASVDDALGIQSPFTSLLKRQVDSQGKQDPTKISFPLGTNNSTRRPLRVAALPAPLFAAAHPASAAPHLLGSAVHAQAAQKVGLLHLTPAEVLRTAVSYFMHRLRSLEGVGTGFGSLTPLTRCPPSLEHLFKLHSDLCGSKTFSRNSSDDCYFSRYDLSLLDSPSASTSLNSGSESNIGDLPPLVDGNSSSGKEIGEDALFELGALVVMANAWLVRQNFADVLRRDRSVRQTSSGATSTQHPLSSGSSNGAAGRASRPSSAASAGSSAGRARPGRALKGKEKEEESASSDILKPLDPLAIISYPWEPLFVPSVSPPPTVQAPAKAPKGKEALKERPKEDEQDSLFIREVVAGREVTMPPTGCHFVTAGTARGALDDWMQEVGPAVFSLVQRHMNGRSGFCFFSSQWNDRSEIAGDVTSGKKDKEPTAGARKDKDGRPSSSLSTKPLSRGSAVVQASQSPEESQENAEFQNSDSPLFGSLLMRVLRHPAFYRALAVLVRVADRAATLPTSPYVGWMLDGLSIADPAVVLSCEWALESRYARQSLLHGVNQNVQASIAAVAAAAAAAAPQKGKTPAKNAEKDKEKEKDDAISVSDRISSEFERAYTVFRTDIRELLQCLFGTPAGKPVASTDQWNVPLGPLAASVQMQNRRRFEAAAARHRQLQEQQQRQLQEAAAAPAQPLKKGEKPAKVAVLAPETLTPPSLPPAIFPGASFGYLLNSDGAKEPVESEELLNQVDDAVEAAGASMEIVSDLIFDWIVDVAQEMSTPEGVHPPPIAGSEEEITSNCKPTSVASGITFDYDTFTGLPVLPQHSLDLAVELRPVLDTINTQSNLSSNVEVSGNDSTTLPTLLLFSTAAKHSEYSPLLHVRLLGKFSTTTSSPDCSLDLFAQPAGKFKEILSEPVKVDDTENTPEPVLVPHPVSASSTKSKGSATSATVPAPQVEQVKYLHFPDFASCVRACARTLSGTRRTLLSVQPFSTTGLLSAGLSSYEASLLGLLVSNISLHSLNSCKNADGDENFSAEEESGKTTIPSQISALAVSAASLEYQLEASIHCKFGFVSQTSEEEKSALEHFLLQCQWRGWLAPPSLRAATTALRVLVARASRRRDAVSALLTVMRLHRLSLRAELRAVGRGVVGLLHAREGGAPGAHALPLPSPKFPNPLLESASTSKSNLKENLESSRAAAPRERLSELLPPEMSVERLEGEWARRAEAAAFAALRLQKPLRQSAISNSSSKEIEATVVDDPSERISRTRRDPAVLQSRTTHFLQRPRKFRPAPSLAESEISAIKQDEEFGIFDGASGGSRSESFSITRVEGRGLLAQPFLPLLDHFLLLEELLKPLVKCVLSPNFNARMLHQMSPPALPRLRETDFQRLLAATEAAGHRTFQELKRTHADAMDFLSAATQCWAVRLGSGVGVEPLVLAAADELLCAAAEDQAAVAGFLLDVMRSLDGTSASLKPYWTRKSDSFADSPRYLLGASEWLQTAWNNTSSPLNSKPIPEIPPYLETLPSVTLRTEIPSVDTELQPVLQQTRASIEAVLTSSYRDAVVLGREKSSSSLNLTEWAHQAEGRLLLSVQRVRLQRTVALASVLGSQRAFTRQLTQESVASAEAIARTWLRARDTAVRATVQRLQTHALRSLELVRVLSGAGSVFTANQPDAPILQTLKFGHTLSSGFASLSLRNTAGSDRSMFLQSRGSRLMGAAEMERMGRTVQQTQMKLGDSSFSDSNSNDYSGNAAAPEEPKILETSLRDDQIWNTSWLNSTASRKTADPGIPLRSTHLGVASRARVLAGGEVVASVVVGAPSDHSKALETVDLLLPDRLEFSDFLIPLLDSSSPMNGTTSANSTVKGPSTTTTKKSVLAGIINSPFGYVGVPRPLLTPSAPPKSHEVLPGGPAAEAQRLYRRTVQQYLSEAEAVIARASECAHIEVPTPLFGADASCDAVSQFSAALPQLLPPSVTALVRDTASYYRDDGASPGRENTSKLLLQDSSVFQGEEELASVRLRASQARVILEPQRSTLLQRAAGLSEDGLTPPGVPLPQLLQVLQLLVHEQHRFLDPDVREVVLTEKTAENVVISEGSSEKNGSDKVPLTAASDNGNSALIRSSADLAQFQTILAIPSSPTASPDQSSPLQAFPLNSIASAEKSGFDSNLQIQAPTLSGKYCFTSNGPSSGGAHAGTSVAAVNAAALAMARTLHRVFAAVVHEVSQAQDSIEKTADISKETTSQCVTVPPLLLASPQNLLSLVKVCIMNSNRTFEAPSSAATIRGEAENRNSGNSTDVNRTNSVWEEIDSGWPVSPGGASPLSPSSSGIAPLFNARSLSQRGQWSLSHLRALTHVLLSARARCAVSAARVVSVRRAAAAVMRLQQFIQAQESAPRPVDFPDYIRLDSKNNRYSPDSASFSTSLGRAESAPQAVASNSLNAVFPALKLPALPLVEFISPASNASVSTSSLSEDPLLPPRPEPEYKLPLLSLLHVDGDGPEPTSTLHDIISVLYSSGNGSDIDLTQLLSDWSGSPVASGSTRAHAHPSGTHAHVPAAATRLISAPFSPPSGFHKASSSRGDLLRSNAHAPLAPYFHPADYASELQSAVMVTAQRSPTSFHADSEVNLKWKQSVEAFRTPFSLGLLNALLVTFAPLSAARENLAVIDCIARGQPFARAAQRLRISRPAILTALCASLGLDVGMNLDQLFALPEQQAQDVLIHAAEGGPEFVHLLVKNVIAAINAHKGHISLALFLNWCSAGHSSPFTEWLSLLPFASTAVANL